MKANYPPINMANVGAVPPLFFAAALCGVLLLDLVATRRCRAADVGLPSECRIALGNLPDEMRVFHCEYTETLSGIGVPAWYIRPIHYSLTVNGGNLYLRTSGHYLDGLGKEYSATYECAFDGERVYYGDQDHDPARQRYAMLSVYDPLSKSDPQREREIYAWYPEAAGVWLPGTVAEFGEFRGSVSEVIHLERQAHSGNVEWEDGGFLRVSLHVPDPIVTRLRRIDLSRQRKRLELNRQEGKESIDRQIEAIGAAQRLAPLRTVVFRLDSKIGFAVSERTDLLEGGRVFRRVKNRKFEQPTGCRIWMPMESEVIYFGDRHKIGEVHEAAQLIATYRVGRVSLREPDSMSYSLDYSDKAGSFLFDRSSSEAQRMPDHEVMYQVSAELETLRSQLHGITPRTWGLGRLILVATLASAMFAAGMVAYNVRGKRGARNPTSE